MVLDWAGCDGVSPTEEVEVACGGLLVGLHFGGKRSGLCRGSEEGDLNVQTNVQLTVYQTKAILIAI